MKKGRNSNGKDDEGGNLWRQVTRSVTPYTARRASLSKTPPAPATIRKAKPPAVSLTRSPEADAGPAHPPRGFDKATATKLRKGKLEVEGKLDLHGLTQVEAFGALQRFIQSAVKVEKRTLLIITGKGERGAGVLKRLLPLWMAEDAFLSRHVLALSPAQPKDGGSGAFYVRLRKSRAV